MPTVNRLTVDGRDFFLPDPVSDLQTEILDAIRAGGGYVNIPGLRGGPGIDILFSPGLPVSWTRIEVGGPDEGTVQPARSAPDGDGLDVI